MRSLTDFGKCRLSLQKLFKKANKFEFFSMRFENYTHKACNIIGDTERMVMLHTTWDFHTLIPQLDTVDFTETICGFYTKELEFKIEFLDWKLNEEMEKGHTVLIVFNIANYFLFDYIGEHDYVHHSTCAIFHPNQKGEYDCFYINSHGEAMMETNFYEHRISRKRKKKITFGEPLDVLCMEKYLSHFRSFTEDLVINYDKTKYHNYYGPNLQDGDNHGICFAFPVIIWYYLTKYYDTTRKWNNDIEIHSVAELLENKQLMPFIHSCFAPYDEKYEQVVMYQPNKRYSSRKCNTYCMSDEENTYSKIHQYTQLSYEDVTINKQLESIIREGKHRFIKKITYSIVSLLSQQGIRKLIE